MSQPIIQVSNLSKSYIISHEGQERYTALRDVMVQKAKKIFSFPKGLRAESVKQTASIEEFWALKDVNFEISQGDRVGIIGRNGAGKSTLLKILSRITEPTTGQIRIKGRVASLLEVGTGFHPELTGRENIYLNGAILGMSRAEIKRKFDEIVDFAEVEKFLDTPVKRYSSGMYVRLAFAVAAHLEPEILVVDEVLAVGDAAFQKKCLGKMEAVSKEEGRTILFVSHNISILSKLCNKSIYLKNGQTSYIGFMQDGISSYLIDNQNNSNSLDIKSKIAALKIDSVFQLIDVNVIQLDYDLNAFVSTIPIVINFKYLIKQDVKGFRIGVDIYHQKLETVVFRTFHDENNNNIDQMNAGFYHSKVEIPAYLFNNSDYKVDVIAGIHGIRMILHDQVQFNLKISNVNGINTNYSDERHGVIMPQLNWITEIIK